MPTQHVYTLEPGRPTPGRVNLLRPPIAFHVGAGILTSFPSATTLVLALGADSPCADARGAGNLGLSATRPFTWFIATHVSIRTSDTSSSPHEPPSQAYGTLSYHPSSPLSALRLRATTRLCRALARVSREAPGPHDALASCERWQADRSRVASRSGAKRVPRHAANALKGLLESAASVHSLSPVTSSAQDDSTSELLRFL